MDGWNTSFLLAWPIFRGYVSFRECTIQVMPPKCKRASWTYYESLHLLALTKFPDLQWVLPFGYSCLAPILVVLKWTLAFFWVSFSEFYIWTVVNHTPDVAWAASLREMLEFFGSLDTTMISLYMVSCLADVFFFFEGPGPGGNKNMVERVEDHLRTEKVGNTILESHEGERWHPQTVTP